MTCQTCQDRLIDEVSGDVTPDAADVDAHVVGCADCQGVLIELLEAYQAIAFGAPPVPVPASIKQRLMARVDAQHSSLRIVPSASTASKSPEHWVSKSFKLFVTSAVAAGVAVVVTHAVMMQRVRDLQRLNEQIYSALSFANKQNVALQESIDNHGGDVKVLQATDLKLVNLTAQPNQPGGACRLFFSNGSDGGLLVVRDAPPPPAGRTYELWLIDGKSNKTAAGTFGVGSDGSARVPIKIDAMTAANASIVAVTDEPPGGVAQPTGSIRFAGKVQ